MTLSNRQADEPVDERAALLPDNKTAGSPQSENYGSAGTDCEAGRVDEETDVPQPAAYSNSYIRKVVFALLIGVFTYNTDSSLVLATHPVIASEFNKLGDSSWLFVSFMLAGAVTQTLYGKLSDIYGRKSVLLVSYALFAAGCALIGVGTSMLQVILGRVISGTGGAGIMVLASILITDLAPLRDVASWQSYINVIATAGRSLGGPLGGWLADTIGWRWSFLGQAPIFAVAILLCWNLLPTVSSSANRPMAESSSKSRLARIDVLGASLLGGGILCLMLPLEIGGQKVPWTHPLIFSLLGLGAVLIFLFSLVELRWAVEPIFPLTLLRQRNVSLSFIIMITQCAAQLGMMFTVPLYFQVTQRASSTLAGAHLFPAVIGNTIGGVASGLLIKRTGRYKALIIFSSVSSMLSYTLLLLRWHGHTGWAESLYVFPGGLGTGMSQSAVFIALQASILPADKATAAAGLFLCFPVGAIVGMAASSAVMLAVFRQVVLDRLTGLGLDAVTIAKVLKKATENVDFIDKASPRISKVLVDGYVRGIAYGHGISILCSFAALLAALFLREKKLS